MILKSYDSFEKDFGGFVWFTKVFQKGPWQRMKHLLYCWGCY